MSCSERENLLQYINQMYNIYISQSNKKRYTQYTGIRRDLNQLKLPGTL